MNYGKLDWETFRTGTIGEKLDDYKFYKGNMTEQEEVAIMNYLTFEVSKCMEYIENKYHKEEKNDSYR